MVSEIPASILTRKGARTTAQVPPLVRQLLDGGRIETRNLCEWLIVDHYSLAQAVFAGSEWVALRSKLQRSGAQSGGKTALGRIQDIGGLLADYECEEQTGRILTLVGEHPSDCVRAWGCYVAVRCGSPKFAGILERIHRFAADEHSSVREIAWLAVRPLVVESPELAVQELLSWVCSPDERIRRFASELTRPRGVWCRRIPVLCDRPVLGLPLLTPLRSDKSAYVRISVGNWLNDASKSAPEFVQEVVRLWQDESDTSETRDIIRRALRTLKKRVNSET